LNRSYKGRERARNDVLAAEALTRWVLALATGSLTSAHLFLQALRSAAARPRAPAPRQQNLGILANIRGELVEAVRHYERAVDRIAQPTTSMVRPQRMSIRHRPYGPAAV